MKGMRLMLVICCCGCCDMLCSIVWMIFRWSLWVSVVLYFSEMISFSSSLIHLSQQYSSGVWCFTSMPTVSNDKCWCWVTTDWTWFVTCRLQKQLNQHNVVLASYDVVRNDIDFFSYVFCSCQCMTMVSHFCNVSVILKWLFMCWYACH